MGMPHKLIKWVGAAYGAAASAYLLAWHMYELVTGVHAPFGLLNPRAPLRPFLILHFSVGLLSVLRFAKFWIPVGPPSERFQLTMKGAFLLSVCNALLYVPSFVRPGTAASTGLLFSSFFLLQTVGRPPSFE